jgi:hypothetical protein
MVRSSPAVADFNGDGGLDVAAACDDGCLYVLNADGSFLAEWLPLQMPGGMESSPCVADADGDGDLEIAVATLTGVAVVDWKDPGTAGEELWNTHRADNARTAWFIGPTEAIAGVVTPRTLTLAARPNPSATGFRFYLGEAGTPWRVSLYDPVGRIVRRVEGAGVLRWDGDAAPGLYLGRAEILEARGVWRPVDCTKIIKAE